MNIGKAPCGDKETHVKKGQWSREEDEKLKDFMMKNGNEGSWISLPKKAGLNRCGKSCRLRWLNYLKPGVKRGDFTEEEDGKILKMYFKIQSRWSIIASYLPGRTDNEIKNHWHTRLKKKALALAKQRVQNPNPNKFQYPTLISNPNPNQYLDLLNTHGTNYTHITPLVTTNNAIINDPISTDKDLCRSKEVGNLVTTIHYCGPNTCWGDQGSSSSGGSCSQLMPYDNLAFQSGFYPNPTNVFQENTGVLDLDENIGGYFGDGNNFESTITSLEEVNQLLNYTSNGLMYNNGNSLIMNNSSNGVIMNNSSNGLMNNSSNGLIVNNNSNGLIVSSSNGLMNNSSNGLIMNNSSNGLIVNNSSNGLIVNNSSNGLIQNNSSNGLIVNNSSNGLIVNNSSNGFIVNNSSNGLIVNNSSNGLIVNNSSNGFIVNDSSNGLIMNNSSFGLMNNSSYGLMNTNSNGLMNTNDGLIMNNISNGLIMDNSSNGLIMNNGSNGLMNNNSFISNDNGYAYYY